VFFVRTAFIADARLEDAPLLPAALRACDASAFFEAAQCPSRLSAAEVALERFGDGL
jgi:hypothetical protein